LSRLVHLPDHSRSLTGSERRLGCLENKWTRGIPIVPGIGRWRETLLEPTTVFLQELHCSLHVMGPSTNTGCYIAYWAATGEGRDFSVYAMQQVEGSNSSTTTKKARDYPSGGYGVILKTYSVCRCAHGPPQEGMGKTGRWPTKDGGS
jgi:hypothetical protein